MLRSPVAMCRPAVDGARTMGMREVRRMLCSPPLLALLPLNCDNRRARETEKTEERAFFTQVICS